MLKVICKHSVLLITTTTTTNKSFPTSSGCKNVEVNLDNPEGTEPSNKKQHGLPRKLTLQAVKRPPKRGGSRIIPRPPKRGGSR